MAITSGEGLVDVTGAYINRMVEEQSWFKENSNTITAAGGLVASVLAWLATQPFAVTPGWQAAILIAGFVLTVLGVNKTPNGFSKSQVSKINAAVASHIDSTRLFTEEPSVDLDAMVAEYNKRRE